MRLGGVPPAIPDLYGPGAYQRDVSPLLWLQPRLGRLVSRGGQLVAARGVRALRHREGGGSPHRAPPSLGSRIWPRMSEAVTSGNVVVVLIYSVTCERQCITQKTCAKASYNTEWVTH